MICTFFLRVLLVLWKEQNKIFFKRIFTWIWKKKNEWKFFFKYFYLVLRTNQGMIKSDVLSRLVFTIVFKRYFYEKNIRTCQNFNISSLKNDTEKNNHSMNSKPILNTFNAVNYIFKKKIKRNISYLFKFINHKF